MALDEKVAAALDDAAKFYNDLLTSDEDQFKKVWDYLARRGIDKNAIYKFKIGYAPPYLGDFLGRALIDHYHPRFE